MKESQTLYESFKSNLNESEETNKYNEEVKTKLFNWAKDKEVVSIGFICNFTAWINNLEDEESKEDFINRFYNEYGNRINIITKPKYEEDETTLRANFKFKAYKNGDAYKASGVIFISTN